MNAILLALMSAGCLTTAADAAEPMDAAEPIDAGAEALNPGWPNAYPWYDPATDGVRRIELPTPKPPPAKPRPRGTGTATFMQWVFWIVLILLLAVLTFALIRAFLHYARGKPVPEKTVAPPEADDDRHRVEALPFPIRTGNRDLFDEARDHYLQGDYSQAVIYLFSYQLIQLDRNQVIRLAKGKTNRQYLREVGKRKSLRQLMEQTMVAFEDVFFGNHSLEQERFQAIWSRVGDFSALASEGAI